MSEVLNYVRKGGDLSEGELITMLRTQLLTTPEKERRNWVRQTVLSLDGYGGAIQIQAATRVKIAIQSLEKEISGLEKLEIKS